MARTARVAARAGVTGIAVAGLIATGAVVDGASAARHGRLVYGTTPLIAATITDHDMVTRGPAQFPAGRLSLALTAKGKEAAIQIGRLAYGYTFADARRDIGTFGASYGPNGPSKKGLRALNNALDHVTLYGGLDVPAGHTRYGEVVLPTAGTYILFNDSGNLPRQPNRLTVTSPSGPQSLKPTDATVTAMTNRRFGGNTRLPANGDITFRNKSTESPHFLVLQHVKVGTTRREVIKSFSGQGRPTFLLPEFASTNAVSEGIAQSMHVNLPKGTYAEACFFPDPKTGMPHAFMGMVRIVHLR